VDINPKAPSLWIFGNEARGIEGLEFLSNVSSVHIPMAGNAESLNLASAVAITLFRVSSASK
jgi:TrmH family RNA methyltransferase